MSSPQHVPKRVRVLLPLLASDKDGEVLAAAAALVKALHGAGMDLHDLARRVVDGPGPAEPIVATAQPRRPDTPRRSYQGRDGYLWRWRWDAENPSHWRHKRMWCGMHRDQLSPKEEKFIDSLERYASSGWSLSDKQAAWLDRIDARLREAAHA